MEQASTPLSAAKVRELLAAVGPQLAGAGPGPLAPAEVEAVLTAMAVQLLSLVRADFLVKARGGVGEGGDRWPPLKPATIARRKRTKGEQSAFKRAAKGAAKGGQRLLKRDYFGGRDVEILRDLGLLLASLSPGLPGQAPPASPHRVFLVRPGLIAVGTRRAGAAAHHKGTRHLPQRRLWPDELPARWWQLILRAGAEALARVLAARLRRGG